jgi:hypothetical protein
MHWSLWLDCLCIYTYRDCGLVWRYSSLCGVPDERGLTISGPGGQRTFEARPPIALSSNGMIALGARIQDVASLITDH